MTEEDPLLLAKAMLTSESKVEEAFRISMMPWLTFTGVTWLFLYCYAHLPSFVVISLSTWATMCLCTLLAMYLRPKAPAAQGKHGLVVVLSLFSLCLGTVFGYWNYSRAGGVGDYWAIGSHEIYEGVSPSEPADARRDAAALAFTKYSRPDARLSTSYAAFGQKYCVAPVMAMGQEYTGTFAAQYFATGKDCCRDLEFTCGDALDEAAHSGLVIFNKTQTALSWAFAQDLDYFMKAARMASARFGIHLAEEPIFFSWVSDTKTAMANLWPEARNIWLLSSMLALPAFAVISFACEAFKRAGNRFSKEKELP